MAKTIMLMTSTLLITACGKKSIDELCEEGCSNAAPFYDRCSAELEAAGIGDLLNPDSCEDSCLSSAEANEALGCEDQFKDWVSCMTNLNWDSLDCDPAGLVTACEDTDVKLTACQEAATTLDDSGL